MRFYSQNLCHDTLPKVYASKGNIVHFQGGRVSNNSSTAKNAFIGTKQSWICQWITIVEHDCIPIALAETGLKKVVFCAVKRHIAMAGIVDMAGSWARLSLHWWKRMENLSWSGRRLGIVNEVGYSFLLVFITGVVVIWALLGVVPCYVFDLASRTPELFSLFTTVFLALWLVSFFWGQRYLRDEFSFTVFFYHTLVWGFMSITVR